MMMTLLLVVGGVAVGGGDGDFLLQLYVGA